MESVLTKFVKLISEHPCLYNHTLPEKVAKESQSAAWAAIASEMEWSEDKCKHKWKTVRNGYVRSLKLATESMGSRQRRPYYLADELQFVAPYVKQHGAADDSDDHASSHGDSDEEYFHNSPTHTKKRSKSEFVSTAASSAKKVKKERSEMIETRPDVDERIEENWMSRTDPIDHADPVDTSSSDYRKMFLLSLLSDINLLSDSNMLMFKIKVLELIHQLFQSQGISE